MAEPDPNTFYKPIKNNYGYCLKLRVATGIVKKHEESTGTVYSLLRSDPNFGNSVWNNEDCRIQWEEAEKVPGERLKFDGVPFFVVGTRHLGCEFGSDNDEKSSIFLDLRRETDEAECEIRKERCPAKIILKEVIKFPHYKIDDNNSTYEKKKWSKIVRTDLCNGSAKTERRIYVELPKSDSHVHAITWKKSQSKSLPSIKRALPSTTSPHCLICNVKLTSSRSTVSIFNGEVKTSHRKMEVSTVLSDIVKQTFVVPDLHSTSICSKCFSLIDDVDSLEEQLETKKQNIGNKFSKTLLEVCGKESAANEMYEDDGDTDYVPYTKSPTRERKRARPPAPSRGRGRPRKRPKISSPQKSPEKSIVKVEIDQDKMDNCAISYITDMESSHSLQTIKKEDIMSDLDASSSVEQPGSLTDDDVGGEGIVAVLESNENMVDQVSVELQGDVLEVVGEVLEKEKKLTKTYSCSECDKQFMSKAAVRNHVKVHTHLASYDCSECDKSFSTKHRLTAHTKTHGNRDKCFTCETCNKSYYTAYQLNNHLKIHKGIVNHICDICGKALSTQKTLELHALTHSGEKPFQCEICGATFRQRSNLHTHIKATHYQEKNHHCTICQKSFVRRRLLIYHMNSIHTGERPYKCELCPASFVYPHYYKRHLRKHTGDKPHKCHLCAKQFTSKENRNAHLFIHSSKRPYECRICGAGFMRKPLCLSHVSGHAAAGLPEELIIFNSPSGLLNPPTAVMLSPEVHEILPQDTTLYEVETDRAVRMVEGTVAQEAADGTEQIYTVRDDKVMKVVSRSGYIIEADDSTRYVIHTTDRGKDENMEHFFATIQGQVVEVRTEDF